MSTFKAGSYDDGSWAPDAASWDKAGSYADGSWSMNAASWDKAGSYDDGSWAMNATSWDKAGSYDDGSWAMNAAPYDKAGSYEDGSWAVSAASTSKAGSYADGSWAANATVVREALAGKRQTPSTPMTTDAAPPWKQCKAAMAETTTLFNDFKSEPDEDPSPSAGSIMMDRAKAIAHIIKQCL